MYLTLYILLLLAFFTHQCFQDWFFFFFLIPLNPLDLSFPIQCKFQEHTGMNCIPSKDVQDLTFINGTLLGNMVFAHVTKLKISGCGHLSWTVESISSLALGLFMVKLSHPYVTTGKTTALTTWTFVGKVMFLLFNMLSRFFIAFLPRKKHLLTLWLESMLLNCDVGEDPWQSLGLQGDQINQY